MTENTTAVDVLVYCLVKHHFKQIQFDGNFWVFLTKFCDMLEYLDLPDMCKISAEKPYIYHRNQEHVVHICKHTIHGWYGKTSKISLSQFFPVSFSSSLSHPSLNPSISTMKYLKTTPPQGPKLSQVSYAKKSKGAKG